MLRRMILNVWDSIVFCMEVTMMYLKISVEWAIIRWKAVMFSVFMLQYFLFFCPLPHLGRVRLPPSTPSRSLQLMDARSPESAETVAAHKLGLRLIWQGMSIGALLSPDNFGLFNALLWYILNLMKIRPVREYNLERTWYLTCLMILQLRLDIQRKYKLQRAIRRQHSVVWMW